ncbi:tRNA (adenosine(37)-N6)-threonylcarbamoyltransferase complex transferase subunit TsaD [Candidatus Parcubacteria bacterium]|nr:tRNA (adenosine(37)-N6)-threonylcarbamoyltransferase complex transferase subunit TsaD [Candidatus Parcubacteria bacterium]
MLILGVDTSCDDTSIAVLRIVARKFEILSNIVSSQEKIHQKYGGVYPTLARRAHEANLPLVLVQALKRSNTNGIGVGAGAKINPRDIDAISVTIGPGLDPCLWEGVNFVKDLAYKFNVPIIPVNHIEGHILANWLPPVDENIKFPAICLVVSGGHTQLILMRKIGKYQILGETRDDAAGECLDKTARILGLPYPGGPAIAAEARDYGGLTSIVLPRPMLRSKDYDFSFSGLKTAVLYDYKKRSAKERKSKKYIQVMCAEIQQAVIDVLIKKTIRAGKDYKVKTILLSGGVAANKELRAQFQQRAKKENFRFQVPNPKFCTDNAAMIAITGWFHRAKALKSARQIKNLQAIPNLRL